MENLAPDLENGEVAVEGGGEQKKAEFEMIRKISHCLKIGNSGVTHGNRHFLYTEVRGLLTCLSYLFSVLKDSGQRRSKKQKSACAWVRSTGWERKAPCNTLDVQRVRSQVLTAMGNVFPLCLKRTNKTLLSFEF